MGLISRFILHKNFPIEYKMSQPQNILKRKKSFKRRRFMENLLGVSMTIILVIIQNFNRAQAVPASMGSGYLRLDRNVAILQQQQQQQLWPQRYIRDVGALLPASLQQKENLKDSLMQSSSTEVSLEQPQGQCLLDGEYVPETTVFCEKQVGCRAIQKTGHCCPDYKCDCQKDGKTYLNGDKLVDPETPCTVCYCQGGEILCSSVTCFHRDDCTPKYIPGVCCPEYDNCPVATNKTILTISTTTVKPEIHVAENNPKITIKEITKPIEIRITNDNKAIPIQQMLKPSPTTSTMATAKIATASTITITSTTTTTTTTTTAATPTILSTQSADVSTTSTIPHANAINTTNSNKIIDHNHQPVKGESFETFSADNNQQHKNGLPSAGPLQSSVEVEDPVPILSIFSTQGLPEDPSKVNIKREYFVTTEGTALAGAASFDTFASNEYANSELIFSQSGAQAQNVFTAGGQQQSSAELDPDTAGSDNIYHIILTTDGPRLASTSENYLALKGISTTEGLPFDDLSASAVESDNKLDTQKNKPTTEGSRKHDSSSESSVIHQHLDEEDSAIPLESNPAYPSLPEDDFSLRDNNFQINDSEDTADEPRHIEPSDAIKSTKHLDEHTYGSGNGMSMDDFAIMPASSSTEGSGELVLSQTTENYDKLKSPEVIQLMYSGEDSSEETRITNNTDFKIEKDFGKILIRNQHDTSLESLDVGSGSGEIKTGNKQQKQREPTTAKPNKKSTAIDIDEIAEASGNGPQDDPKLDAESLKLDETANDTPTNILTSTKNNILTVKLKPVLDKLFHDGMH